MTEPVLATPPTGVEPRPGRLLSLDVLRGLTIALMILVNTPGSWSHVYAPFLHAEWHGLTLTDLVFPSFTFIVGVSLVLSLARFGWAGEPAPDGGARAVGPALGKIARRTALIFLVGVLLNYFPFYTTTLGELRIYGVLQRIALAYGFAATLCLLVPPRHWLTAAGVVLVGYWAVLGFGGSPPDPYGLETNAKRAFDLATIGPAHMYGGFGVPFDPEGFIGLLGTAGNMLFGAWAGRLVMTTPDRPTLVRRLLLFGLALVVVGLAWRGLLPINKPLWTGSYACVSSGIAACALGVLMEWLDLRGHTGWARPLVHFGSNPLAIYALSSVLSTTMYEVATWRDAAGETRTLYGWLYGDVFARLIPWPKLASLAFALTIVTICWAVAAALWRRRVFIKL